MIQPSFQEFQRLAKRGNLIPVYDVFSADLLTPVSAYLRVAQGARYSFLLESVEGGEKIARYTFAGANPARAFAGFAAAGGWGDRVLQLRHGEADRAAPQTVARRHRRVRGHADVLSRAHRVRPCAAPHVDCAQRLHRGAGDSSGEVYQSGEGDPANPADAGRAGGRRAARKEEGREITCAAGHVEFQAEGVPGGGAEG